jgi:uncharacterized protein
MRPSHLIAAAGLALLLLLGLSAPRALAAAQTLTFPPLTGRVVDDAHVLPAAVQSELTAKLADLERRTSRQLVVVTLPSLQGQDAATYGYQLLRTWGIGQKGTNNGALFIIVPSEHKVRVEVGYGLEPILTDALSSQILQEKVLPLFKAGDLPGGVEAGTSALIDQLGADTSTAEDKAAAAEQAQLSTAGHGRRPGNVFGLIIPLVFIIIVVSGVFRGGRGGGFLPALMLGSLLGGMRGDRDDDDWGGGGGGGGFSGGGGSGGGGGASGGW